MSLIIIAIICLGIYYLYGFITDQETKRQRKNDPKRKVLNFIQLKPIYFCNTKIICMII